MDIALWIAQGLLALAFLGAGRYVSLDYWIRRRFMPGAASTAG